MLLDWNSIESVSKWESFFWWSGIVCLILLAATEIISHYVFGGRKEHLVAMRERAVAEQQRQAIENADARHADEVSKLKKKTEEAERKIGAFQRQQADRQLPAAQRNALIQALSSFRGQRITVVCLMGDAEGCQFAEAFKAVFIASGWDCVGVNQSVITGRQPVGIETTVNQTEAEAGRIPRAADVLVRTLMSLGLVKQEIFGHNEVPAGQIQFRVGRKPTT